MCGGGGGGGGGSAESVALQRQSLALSKEQFAESKRQWGAQFDWQRKKSEEQKRAAEARPGKGPVRTAEYAASALGDRLLVWGVVEDSDYAARVEAAAPKGTIEWRGFLPTADLQKEIGFCRALLNTPKWNEAYGNVVVEAMACGVPVVAFDRGGPGELIASGLTGWLVPPDDVSAMTTQWNWPTCCPGIVTMRVISTDEPLANGSTRKLSTCVSSVPA